MRAEFHSNHYYSSDPPSKCKGGKNCYYLKKSGREAVLIEQSKTAAIYRENKAETGMGDRSEC